MHKKDIKLFNSICTNSQLHELSKTKRISKKQIKDITDKSLNKEALSLQEVSVLLNCEKEDHLNIVFDAAKKLKNLVYGNRIVLFAPLYIGNKCINDCHYCGYKRSNKKVLRKTLSKNEINAEIKTLLSEGHRRIIAVFGEHPEYNANMIADTIKHIYSIKENNSNIKRININAAPLNIEDFKIVKKSGIGTYQIFQETYHEETYRIVHPQNTLKGDYLNRLFALDRAFEAGIDDVGLGVLFGLYDWKYEVLSLAKHALYLNKKFGVGPHTISFPRLKNAFGVKINNKYRVSDKEFKKIIAVIRLAVPYTGLILTARENKKLRKELIPYGVSQIDAGSSIEIGSYQRIRSNKHIENAQFKLGDMRSLEETIYDLLIQGNIPSFCTACYRKGRTGEHFMEYAIPGFIHKYCAPNAILTFAEYLRDHASVKTKEKGLEVIKSEMRKIKSEIKRDELQFRLNKIMMLNDSDILF